MQFPDSVSKNINKFVKSPRLRLYYNLDNKRRLHISKLHLVIEKKIFERSRVAAQDPIPIEGENNMLRNVIPSLYYTILDFKCFAYLNIRSIPQLMAKEVIP